MANATVDREETELIFPAFLGTKAKIKATFRYLSFTFKEDLIL